VIIKLEKNNTNDTMVGVWYMRDIEKGENMRLPHRDPNAPLITVDDLAKIGVKYSFVCYSVSFRTFSFVTFQIPVANYRAGLDKIKADNGYDYEDEITVSKSKLPNYDEKVLTFYLISSFCHTIFRSRYSLKSICTRTMKYVM
jgi:hypothetical protein